MRIFLILTTNLRIRIWDHVLFALGSGSGILYISFFRISDPGANPYFLDSLVTNFWVKFFFNWLKSFLFLFKFFYINFHLREMYYRVIGSEIRDPELKNPNPGSRIASRIRNTDFTGDGNVNEHPCSGPLKPFRWYTPILLYIIKQNHYHVLGPYRCCSYSCPL